MESQTDTQATTATRAFAFNSLSDVLSSVKSNAWIVATIGFSLVFLHFARIGFLPQISLAEIGLIAAGTSVLVLFAMLAFSVLLYMPGTVLAEWAHGQLINGAPLSTQFLPGAALISGVILSYCGLLIATGAYYLFLLPASNVATAVTIGLLIMGASAYTVSSSLPRKISKTLFKGRAELAGRLEFGIRCTGLYSFLLPVSALIVLIFVPTLASAPKSSSPILLCFFPALHWFIVLASYKRTAARVLLILAAIGVALAMTGALMGAIDSAARAFGFGMLKKHTLIVTERGCIAARASSMVRDCTPLDDGLFEIRNVTLLSRLGNQFVVGSSDWKTRKDGYVTLPSTDVVSWFPNVKKPETSADPKKP